MALYLVIERPRGASMVRRGSRVRVPTSALCSPPRDAERLVIGVNANCGIPTRPRMSEVS